MPNGSHYLFHRKPIKVDNSLMRPLQLESFSAHEQNFVPIIVISIVSKVSLLTFHYDSLNNLAFGVVSFNPLKGYKDQGIKVSRYKVC